MNRIFDPVHDYIELEEDEYDLIMSPLFQRLQRIKQTGPLHILFPGASQSRYAHSIGVFHIVTKMIERLKKTKSIHFLKGKQEEKELRFAALLHDIGHLPMSHCGETALVSNYETKVRSECKRQKRKLNIAKLDWRTLFNEKYVSSDTKLHECLSVEMILHNKEIKNILERKNYSCRKEDNRNQGFSLRKERIARIIVGMNKRQRLNALLHSELDADRLDYLLRDSYFTGVGYGKIDLDYIISRLVTPSEGELEDNEFLCVEYKGLHTVEHYILSRFFLRTQVIYNRKNRILDILFDEVMQYMLSSRKKKDYHILDLEELLGHIRKGERDDLHNIYVYTDGQIFTKMRKLHEELDAKVKANQGSERESYINDCIKMIMDAQIAEPVASAQILVKLERSEKASRDKGYPSERRRIESEAKKISKKAASELSISPEKIKVDVTPVGLMKYTNIKDPQQKSDEQTNKEAVRLYIENAQKSEDKIKCAAQSNATILNDLVDRELLLFNVFYVKSSKEQSEDMRKKIKGYYKKFVEENFQNV